MEKNNRVHSVSFNVWVEISTKNNMTISEMENIAGLHVKNCILEHPDADDCTITDVDVSVVTPAMLAELYEKMTCSEKDDFLRFTGNN